MPLSPSDEILNRMLELADHYARQGDAYQLDRLRMTAREYGAALTQLRETLDRRERLLARLAALDEHVALSASVTSFMERL